jgi:hypothetical protein
MSLIHLPVAPYVTSTFPPVLLLLLFGSWPLVYGHPTRRGESRADGTYGKCSSRLLLRSSFAPSRTGTLSKFSVFFFFFERVCLFCINSNIVSTTVTWLHHGNNDTWNIYDIYRESDSCCAEEVRDYWVYKVNDEFNFLLFFVCVRIDIAFRLKQSPSSTANLKRFTGPTNDICCAREFLNNVIAPTFCLKSFLNKCTRREVNKFFK